MNRQIEACTQCERLIDHCSEIARVKRKAYLDDDYWGGPVGNLGDPKAELLVVGLAPGAHGANRTGRMFTGDRSGDWLYRALHKAGFANQPESTWRGDGLQLRNAAITNACHCAPPDNKPTRDELGNCRDWFDQTIHLLNVKVVIALGQIAWRNVVAFAKNEEWYKGPIPKFGHGAECVFRAPGFAGSPMETASRTTRLRQRPVKMLGSFHPSQQNTFTGRLTEEMFDAVFARAVELLQT